MVQKTEFKKVDCEIVRITEKAFKISFGPAAEDECWVPKSICDNENLNTFEENDEVLLEVAQWFYDKNLKGKFS